MKVIYTAAGMRAYLDSSLNISKLVEYDKYITKQEDIKRLLQVKEVTHDEEGNRIIDIPQKKILKLIELVNNNTSTTISTIKLIHSLLKVLEVNFETMRTDLENIFKD